MVDVHTKFLAAKFTLGDNMDENIDVFDEKENLIGRKLKSEAHKDGSWHRGVHIWILVDNKIFLQKRSCKKDIFPGCFDVGCAGHLKSGENYEDAAIRELEEELEIKAKKRDLIYLDSRKQITFIKEKKIISKEFLKVFALKIKNTNNVKINKDEIEEVRLFDIKELEDLLKNKPEMFVEDIEYFFDAINKIKKLF